MRESESKKLLVKHPYERCASNDNDKNDGKDLLEQLLQDSSASYTYSFESNRSSCDSWERKLRRDNRPKPWAMSEEYKPLQATKFNDIDMVFEQFKQKPLFTSRWDRVFQIRNRLEKPSLSENKDWLKENYFREWLQERLKEQKYQLNFSRKSANKTSLRDGTTCGVRLSLHNKPDSSVAMPQMTYKQTTEKKLTNKTNDQCNNSINNTHTGIVKTTPPKRNQTSTPISIDDTDNLVKVTKKKSRRKKKRAKSVPPIVCIEKRTLEENSDGSHSENESETGETRDRCPSFSGASQMTSSRMTSSSSGRNSSRRFSVSYILRDFPTSGGGPHRDLYETYHWKRLKREREDRASTMIQACARGFLTRKRLENLKMRVSDRHDIGWDVFVQHYRYLLERLQTRNNIYPPHRILDYTEVAEFLDRKEKYEGAFYRAAHGDRLPRGDIKMFFSFCGLNPTEKEISTAYRQVFRGCGKKAEVIILLDCSIPESSHSYKLRQYILRDLLNSLDIGWQRIRIAFIPYNSAVFQWFGLTTFKKREDIIDAVLQVKYASGTTSLEMALKKARELAKEGRSGLPKTIIILDGKSCSNPVVNDEVNKSISDDINVCAVGIGQETNVEELSLITQNNDRVVRVKDFYSIRFVKEDILAQVEMARCTQCETGGHAEVWGNKPITQPRYSISRQRSTESGYITGEDCPLITPDPQSIQKNPLTKLTHNDIYKPKSTTLTTQMSLSNFYSDEGRGFVYNGTMKDGFLGNGLGLSVDECLEMLWMIYPPTGSKLDPMHRSSWMKPMVDGEETGVYAEDLEGTDFDTCLKLVLKSKLERDGVINMPIGSKDVEQVTDYDTAVRYASAYIQNQRVQRAEEWEKHHIIEAGKTAYESERQRENVVRLKTSHRPCCEALNYQG